MMVKIKEDLAYYHDHTTPTFYKAGQEVELSEKDGEYFLKCGWATKKTQSNKSANHKVIEPRETK